MLSLTWVVLPAAINVSLSGLVFAVARRSAPRSRLLAFLILIVGVSSLTAYTALDRPGHSTWEAALVAGAIVGITWVPGALLALLGAGRSSTAEVAICIATVLVSGILGAVFSITGLFCVCFILHDCL